MKGCIILFKFLLEMNLILCLVSYCISFSYIISVTFIIAMALVKFVNTILFISFICKIEPFIFQYLPQYFIYNICQFQVGWIITILPLSNSIRCYMKVRNLLLHYHKFQKFMEMMKWEENGELYKNF
jgi:hypothetical protein